MRADQLTRLEALHDRLIDAAISDADPSHWTAAGKLPKDMTQAERGDAKWCRSMAVSTVALAMQVTRLMQNPTTGGAVVPDTPEKPVAQQPQDEEATVEAEIARYEKAAEGVIAKMRDGPHGKRQRP
jgi:hypothetical protein